MIKIAAISGQSNSGKDAAADHLVEHFGFTKVALADPVKQYGAHVFHFTPEQLWGPSTARNAFDSRFKECYSPTEGDDAWMAVFRRAETFNKKFIKDLFPDSPLMQGQAFHALEQWLEKLSYEHPKLSPRIMLQSFGTEYGRTLKGDIWIKHAIRVSKLLLAGGYRYDKSEGLFLAKGSKCTGVVISDVRFQNELTELKKENSFLVRIKRPSTDGVAVTLGLTHHASELEQQSFTDDQFNFIINNDKGLNSFLEAVDVVGFMLTS